MRFDVLTLFPAMFDAVTKESITGRAIESGIFSLYCHDIRDYTQDKHRRCDDYPYGGGCGMVMSAQPIKSCFDAVCVEAGARPHLIFMSPRGEVLTQKKAAELSKLPNIAILCGHYEGVDNRVIDEIVDEEISIGDYVLTGGEIPAMALIDAVSRMLPGVLKEEAGYEIESFYDGLLEYPQYTRPEEIFNKRVPDVLLSGHHENIRLWRKKESLRATLIRRPDLLKNRTLSKEEEMLLLEIEDEIKRAAEHLRERQGGGD